MPGRVFLLSFSKDAAKVQSCWPEVIRPTYQATSREESDRVAQSPPLPPMLAAPRRSPAISCSTAWALEGFTGSLPA